MAEAFLLSEERRGQKAFARRVKHAVSMMTTGVYALFGGAFWGPVVNGRPFTLLNLVSVGGAVAFTALTLYLVPKGEVDDA